LLDEVEAGKWAARPLLLAEARDRRIDRDADFTAVYRRLGRGQPPPSTIGVVCFSSKEVRDERVDDPVGIDIHARRRCGRLRSRDGQRVGERLTAAQLQAHGWGCRIPPGETLLNCRSPGSEPLPAGPTEVNFLVFDASGTTFIGTEHLIR